MSKKLAIRAAVIAVSIIVLFVGYQWFQTWSLDPENEAKTNTVGMIAALEVTDKGLQAVAFNADGSEKAAPGLPAGKEDRELAWGATGSHVFISSNRDEETYNIYRWNPVTGAFDRRTRGSRSKAAPFFYLDGSVDSLRKGLVTGGGAVSVFDPKMMTLEQILPPLERGTDVSDEGGGMVGPMSGIYKNLGDSFRSARYAGDTQTIYSLMRREGGEVLVLSSLKPMPRPDGTQGPPNPIPVLAGRKLSWDVAQNGSAVVSINDFQWPDPDNVPADFIKNGEPVMPFANALMSLGVPGRADGAAGPIAIFPPNGERAGDISISPDGSKVAAVIGVEKDGAFVPRLLVVFPNKANGGSEAIPLSEGAVSSPYWSPDSKEIVFLKNTGGKRGIFKILASGGVEMRVGSSDKDYRSPKFSPQMAQ